MSGKFFGVISHIVCTPLSSKSGSDAGGKLCKETVVDVIFKDPLVELVLLDRTGVPASCRCIDQRFVDLTSCDLNIIGFMAHHSKLVTSRKTSSRWEESLLKTVC